MHDHIRRGLLQRGGILLAAGLIGSAGTRALAGEHDSKTRDRDCVQSLGISAERDKICATCRYWGGMRKTSTDRKTVSCETIGWCNNSESYNYHMVTAPENGPLDCWKKWEAL